MSQGRVCIIRHSYYPAELNVKREAEALRDAGFEVDVLCLRGEGEPPREIVEGVTVRRMPVRHRRASVGRYFFEYVSFFLLASLTVTALHLRRRFAAVQVNTMPDWLVFAALGPRLAGAKVVLHVHEPMPELWETEFSGRVASRFLFVAIRLAERWSIRFAHHALTVTEDLKARLVERGARAGKISVVLNVPDDRLFNAGVVAAHAPARGKGEGLFRLVSHGALEERYGIRTMLDAIEEVRGEVPGVRLTLMGRGELGDEVRRRIDEEGLSPHVRYLGWVDFEEMLARIVEADAAIVAQLENPYSSLVHTNKMFEYVALERPVIMTRLEAVRTTFGSDAFAYFTPGDPHDLARAIRSLAGDPALGRRLAARAGEVYREHVWKEESRVYLGVYHRLLEGRN